MISCMLIYKSLFLICRFLTLPANPSPSIQATDNDTTKQQHQRPRKPARPASVNPQPDGDTNQCWYRYRPTDEAKSSQPKPDVLILTSSGPNLAVLLGSHLLFKFAACPSSFVSRKRFHSYGPSASSRYPRKKLASNFATAACDARSRSSRMAN